MAKDDPNSAARAASGSWPLSLSYYTVPELDAVEVAHIAADCGCQHIGLRLLGGQPGDSETPLMRDQALRRELLAAMRARGLSALDANTARLVPGTRVKDFEAFLDIAAELGARHVLTTMDDRDVDRRRDNFTALCEAAAARGLTVDLEFVPWLSVPNVAAAAAEVRRCAHPAAGIALDALHFFRSGSTLADLEGLPASWFRYLQICDAPQRKTPPDRNELIHEAVKERLLPGEGDIELAELLRAFATPLPLALEIPQAGLSKTLGARARVHRAVQATRLLIESL